MLLVRLALLAVLLVPPHAGAASARRPVAVAAAANLKPALDALERAFEAAHPEADLVVTLGASGAFYAQLVNGAPFDLFMSADRDYPRKVVLAGLAVEEEVYALGRLAVWLPAGAMVAFQERGLAALGDPAVSRIAIANPAVAPYGRAAEAALRGAGVLEAVRPKLVLGQNVAQASQFAEAGAADAALLPLSLARAPKLAAAGRAFPLPASAHPPIEQAAVVLSGAREPALARAFLEFVRSERGRAILVASGYDVPGAR